MSKIAWAPFSPKALDSIANSDAFLNLWEGAVRSSKTVSSIIRWIEHVKESPHTEFLMTGKTSDTLFRNVIGGPLGILNILGKQGAVYNKSGQGGAQLIFRFGSQRKVAYCLGANDVKAEGNVRGMTTAGWYADEVTLYPESFVNMAISRMSLPGSKGFWTMNPDSPYHYIKKGFIDPAREKGYRCWHFVLDDNLALTSEYKENLKKAYAGLWYKRLIDGQWVLAEGAIYDMFNEEHHVVPPMTWAPRDWDRLVVGCDYATGNPTAFLLIGETTVGFLPAYFVLKEYYWDSVKEGRQKTDAEYSRDLQDFITGIPVDAVVVDPSAASFIAQLIQDGVPNVKHADNSVLDGIRNVGTLFKANRLHILDQECPHLLEELTSYVWDPVAQKLGQDKPLKVNDHALDGLRYGIRYLETIPRPFDPRTRNALQEARFYD